MTKRIFVFIIVSQLFLNGLWASTHVENVEHHNHNVSHQHIDIDSDSLTEQEIADNESEEHATDNHCHVHLVAFVLSTGINYFEPQVSEKALTFNTRLTSLTYIPAVRPPLV